MKTTIQEDCSFITYRQKNRDVEEMKKRSRLFFKFVNSRRTIRDFSDQPIPEEVIENIVRSASTAPSGAHKQPWTFCVVKSPEIKKQIRKAAEQQEQESYNGRMTEEWRKDLACLGTDWHKPFIEVAPYLIVVFKRSYELEEGNYKHQNYYVTESCGLACGFLLAAIHDAGLVALTYTPSPLNFLSKILHRPANEKPFLVVPVGYPAKDCRIPDLKRKSLKQIIQWF
ncbi:MAG: nitroreductase family protein [Bacteroidota bacterium]|nr:nitroreductase family protein [Bacteroidota bacterium]